MTLKRIGKYWTIFVGAQAVMTFSTLAGALECFE